MLFSIAMGGAIGTVARYGLGGLAQRWSADFPWGTLTINVLGSLLLGFLMRYLLSTAVSTEVRAGLTIGFCGGFTTFSTFSYELVMLADSGNVGRAVGYALASVALSLGAVVGGFWLARVALAPR